jgi:hypothetical protein
MAEFYPGHNPLSCIAEAVVDVLERSGPLIAAQLFGELRQAGWRNVGVVDDGSLIPLTLDHVTRVLEDHLRPHVADAGAGRWTLAGPRPPHPPPWEMFPYPWGSLGWRMGRGEDYWIKFVRWYSGLDGAAQAAYRAAHPEPADWREFFAFLSLPAGDRAARLAWRERREATLREFLEGAYREGRRAEESGHLAEAAAQYSIIIRRDGNFRDALDRLKQLQTESFEDAESGAAADRGGG